MSLSQSNHFDTGDSDFYKRNYVIVSASNLETIGGQVTHGELLYSEQKSLDGNLKSISTFCLCQLSSSNGSYLSV